MDDDVQPRKLGKLKFEFDPYDQALHITWPTGVDEWIHKFTMRAVSELVTKAFNEGCLAASDKRKDELTETSRQLVKLTLEASGHLIRHQEYILEKTLFDAAMRVQLALEGVS